MRRIGSSSSTTRIRFSLRWPESVPAGIPRLSVSNETKSTWGREILQFFVWIRRIRLAGSRAGRNGLASLRARARRS